MQALLALCIAPFTMLLWGWTLATLWGWFIVSSFGLAPLAVWQAYGIAMVAQFVLVPYKYEEEPDPDHLKNAIFSVLIKCGTYLGIGWIVHKLI